MKRGNGRGDQTNKLRSRGVAKGIGKIGKRRVRGHEKEIQRRRGRKRKMERKKREALLKRFLGASRTARNKNRENGKKIKRQG